MSVPSAVRPTRRHVFPFIVAFFPMVWFVFRDSPVRVVDGQRVVTPLSRTVALALLAVVASYTIAVTVMLVVVSPGESSPTWQRMLFRPTNDTLVVLVGLCLVFVAYVTFEAITELPWWAELVVGIPLLWPLLAAILVTFAVGNAVPGLQSFALQVGFTVIGLSLSAAWVFLLSTGFARVLLSAK